MRVLVIGGTGFLSSAIVKEMQAAGHEVSIFTRGQRPAPNGVTAIVGDRKNYAAFKAALSQHTFDAVIDCIGYVPEDAQSDVETFAGRVGHFIFISTDFVYGGEPRKLPLREDTTPTEAYNDYGRNKVKCERILLQAWQDAQFPATILRPPHVMGAGSHLGTGSWHGRDPMLIDRLRQGAPVMVLDGGMLLIQPVVHTDVGRACAAALGKRQTFGQVYNMAGNEVVTTKEYHQIVGECLGCPVAFLSLPSSVYVEAFPDRRPFAQHRVYDIGKLIRDTGYTPQITVREAIREMVDWLQASGQAQPYQAQPLEEAIAAAIQNRDEELLRLLRNA
ncbi:MAG: NAD-dependent epimerase/dehydratase family protein [Abditibacteriales bacterium]|nr:NAD-dependent epimerase/dehydratase family protein [Abditibacteriales bacterium]MDW8364466.1 NAD-dependent epimerase/dehydratase family protein [Abditibacteriales bacterium]